MTVKRHAKFWLQADKKWTEKWFKFVTSKDDVESWSVSWSRNVTMEFIEALSKYIWDCDMISCNKFTKNKELFMIEEAKKYWKLNKQFNPNMHKDDIKKNRNGWNKARKKTIL